MQFAGCSCSTTRWSILRGPGKQADRDVPCLDEVRRSNILIVIVGHRYGTLSTGLHISFSQAEYDEGHGLKKPCLVYMRDDDVPILPKHMEREPEKLSRLEEWKAILRERHTVAAFRESRDLAIQVAADLSRTIIELTEAARAREEARITSSGQVVDESSSLIVDATKQGLSEQALLSALRRSVSSWCPLRNSLGLACFSVAHLQIEVSFGKWLRVFRQQVFGSGLMKQVLNQASSGSEKSNANLMPPTS